MQPAVCNWLCNVVMGNLIVHKQCAIDCAMLSWEIESAASSVQLVVQCFHGEFDCATSNVQCCHGEFDSAASNVPLIVQCCHGEFNGMPAMCHWLCNVVMGN